MPGWDGLEVPRRITADHELDDVRVVMLTTFEPDENAFESLACRGQRVPAQRR
jgi:CheY-like chemotaxis protein